MKFERSGQIFEKVSNIKFHQNPSNGSRVVPCGPIDMTKLIVAFRNFANAPKQEEMRQNCCNVRIFQDWYNFLEIAQRESWLCQQRFGRICYLHLQGCSKVRMQCKYTGPCVHNYLRTLSLTQTAQQKLAGYRPHDHSFRKNGSVTPHRDRRV
jgi:hypothetical protein